MDDHKSETFNANKHIELNQCIWDTLNGLQSRFSDRTAHACVYKDGYGVFGDVSGTSEQAYKELASLVKPGRVILVRGTGPRIEYPEWRQIRTAPGYIMVLDIPVKEDAVNYVKLSHSDVSEMLELSKISGLSPGFIAGKIEIGDYYGVREDGLLVSMAGERLHFEGYTELSTVCTHPDYRNRGYGGGLSCVVCHKIQEKGEVPFLHVVENNTDAIRLYEKLGFRKCITGYYDVLERTTFV